MITRDQKRCVWLYVSMCAWVWGVCEYTFVYVCVLYLYIYINIYIYVYTHTYIYICLYIYVYICLYTYVNTYKYLNMYIYIYIWIYGDVGVCVCLRVRGYESLHMVCFNTGSFHCVGPYSGHIYMNMNLYFWKCILRYIHTYIYI